MNVNNFQFYLIGDGFESRKPKAQKEAKGEFDNINFIVRKIAMNLFLLLLL